MSMVLAVPSGRPNRGGPGDPATSPQAAVPTSSGLEAEAQDSAAAALSLHPAALGICSTVNAELGRITSPETKIRPGTIPQLPSPPQVPPAGQSAAVAQGELMLLHTPATPVQSAEEAQAFWSRLLHRA